MTSLENFSLMIEGGRPRWMPFDLPTTEPVAESIVKATGRLPEEAFNSDFRPVDAAILGDDPEKWQAAAHHPRQKPSSMPFSADSKPLPKQGRKCFAKCHPIHKNRKSAEMSETNLSQNENGKEKDPACSDTPFGFFLFRIKPIQRLQL